MTSVLVRIEGQVAVLLLNEPQTHHALSRKLVLALHRALDEPMVQQSRALVIGSVGPYYCAGANIDDLRDGWMSGQEPQSDPVRFFQRLTDDPRPSVAAVDGGAIGGGVELMLSCDLAVACRTAWFSLPELHHGVIPNTALMRLQQMVGLRRMMYATLTAQRLSSQQALEWGMVNDVVEQDALGAAIDLAQRIVAKVAPGSTAVAKHFAHQHAVTQWGNVHQSLQAVPENEWQEGLRAFTEKRAANYETFWQQQRDADTKP